jgi:hypothetical protein
MVQLARLLGAKEEVVVDEGGGHENLFGNIV